MIINEKKYRISFLIIVLVLMGTLFIFKLAQLQIVDNEYYSNLAENKIIQKISETAPRGSIFTSDGYEIAKNKIGYTIELTYTNISDEDQNKVLLNLYNILENNDEEFTDDFPILITNGKFVYTYKIDEEYWKKDNDISSDATATEVLELLRNKYNVKEEVNNEVALKAIESVHMDSNLPIKISEGEVIFTYSYKEEDWKKWYGFSEEEYTLSAGDAFNKLREKYSIDDSYTAEDARKILVLRQSIKSQGFRSWEPIEIASNVNKETAFEIDTNIHLLAGVVVTANPIRYYPFENLASHVLGYIGKVNEIDVEEKGYKMNDLKGISGIEAAFEEYLKGEDGEKFAVTDYMGRPQEDDLTSEVIDPIPGDDVYLTIDYDVQKAAEAALENQIKSIKKLRAPKASSGAVVVLNVNTGAVLALASYPEYDPNLFSTGISSENWGKLNVLVDDPLYPKPLYNNATLTALQPGSTFKPMMAISALEENVLTKNSRIYCGKTYSRFPQFSCLGYHGNETVVSAIQDSCNIFFYETGYRLGVDAIEKYAKMYGLGTKTGIEIAESSGYLATRDEKRRIWTYSASDYIRNTVGIDGTAEIINDEGNKQEVYKSYAIAKELFTNITEEYDSYGDVFRQVSKILSKYNIKESKYLHRITQYVLAGRWVATDTVNASIGQGGNSFTPIQLANYVATLVNGGYHREVYLVEKVVSNDGTIVYQHEEKVINKLDIDEKNIKLVKEGMKRVALYSTGRYAFLGFDHENIGVGGKTGTAQYGSEKIDNTAWFECFTPYEDPEIVVVSMIIQGKTSSNAVPIAREVVDAYFYNNDSVEEDLE
ncbi:MAG: penicillin-binding transpeptidase domain-containing protein [Eubacteriaceae bacterium]